VEVFHTSLKRLVIVPPNIAIMRADGYFGFISGGQGPVPGSVIIHKAGILFQKRLTKGCFHLFTIYFIEHA
jgi:hypothetical protein